MKYLNCHGESTLSKEITRDLIKTRSHARIHVPIYLFMGPGTFFRHVHGCTNVFKVCSWEYVRSINVFSERTCFIVRIEDVPYKHKYKVTIYLPSVTNYIFNRIMKRNNNFPFPATSSGGFPTGTFKFCEI